VKSTFASSASVEEVFDVLVSPERAATKAERFGDGALLKAHEQRPDGSVSLTVSRELPGGVPGFLEKFLPKDGRVTESFDWDPPAADGARHGRWNAVIPGAPAKLGGTMRLEPTATGSRYTIDGEGQVSVPLIGGKAARFIGEMVEKLAAKEHQLMLTTL